MHEYMTQRMVALVAFTYAQWDLNPGDPFLATPDDRPYLKRTGKARDDDAPAAAPRAPAAPQRVAPVGPVAEAAAEPVAAPVAPIAEPAVGETPSAPRYDADGRIINEFEDLPAASVDTGASTENAAPAEPPAAPTSRRRGRPSNAERAAAAASSPAEK